MNLFKIVSRHHLSYTAVVSWDFSRRISFCGKSKVVFWINLCWRLHFVFCNLVTQLKYTKRLRKKLENLSLLIKFPYYWFAISSINSIFKSVYKISKANWFLQHNFIIPRISLKINFFHNLFPTKKKYFQVFSKTFPFNMFCNIHNIKCV